MSGSKRPGWPWWHAIGLAMAGALFAYWNWVHVLGASVEIPMGYGLRDAWSNQPIQARMPYWAPIWAPSIVLGAVAFLLAGGFLRNGRPQAFRTITLCIMLNLLSFPFNLALNEIVATIYVYPPSAWYIPVHDVGMSFLAGLGTAAILFWAHGIAWVIVSIVIGYAIAQLSKIAKLI